MRKSIIRRSISAAVVISMLVMLLLPMSVQAATKNYCFKTLSPGKVAVDSYKYNAKTGIHYTYYKIAVSKPGRLNFTLSADTMISLYTSSADVSTGTKKGSRISLSNNTESKMIAVEKGTYYLYILSGKCKYTFTADATPTNYCIAKAKALKAKTTTYNVFTPRTNFTRWFKVTNPGKKKIVITTNTSDSAYNTVIFNSKLQRLATVKNGSDRKFCTKTAQPKGTYYICVRYQYRYADDYDYAFGDVITLKWNN